MIVVEHDRDTMVEADHIIDMGPGAGIHGGYVVAQGTPEEIIRNPNSLTGQYLSGEVEIPGAVAPTSDRQSLAHLARRASK